MDDYNCSYSEDSSDLPLVSLASFYMEGVGIPLIGCFGIAGNIVTVWVIRWANQESPKTCYYHRRKVWILMPAW